MKLNHAYISIRTTTDGPLRDGFVVGRHPAGISAVVLRRGGKLVAMPVETMIEVARRASVDAASQVTETKPKKTKRKGRKR